MADTRPAAIAAARSYAMRDVLARSAARVPTRGVVPRESASLTPDVVSFCRERLTGFKTPKHVVIVDELPKNPTGKVLKRELRERYSLFAQRT